MYNIGICDDKEIICSLVEKMIMCYAEKKKITINITIWYSGEGLCRYLEENNHMDILFLDIELIHMTGIDVGNFIRNQLEDRNMQIVYISGEASYAEKLFKTQPLDFLKKPFTQEQLEEVLELAFKILDRRAEKFIFQYGKDYYYIPYGKIMYFASEGRKIQIVTKNGEREFYGRLREVVKALPGEFVMIHQSYVVNKEYVIRYAYEAVELIDGTELTISRINRKQVREKFLGMI